MSDLIERLRTLGVGPSYSLCQEAADEIERLNCALTISRGKHENAIAEIERLRSNLEHYEETLCDLHYKDERIAKLEAVVDAVTGGIPSEITEALAALEDEYTIKIKGIPSKLEPPAEVDDGS